MGQGRRVERVARVEKKNEGFVEGMVEEEQVGKGKEGERGGRGLKKEVIMERNVALGATVQKKRKRNNGGLEEEIVAKKMKSLRRSSRIAKQNGKKDYRIVMEEENQTL